MLARPRIDQSTLGTVYPFPQTNNSSVIPNATFNVDVPVQSITQEAVFAAVPAIQQVLPTLLDSAAKSVTERPEAFKPVADALTPQIVASSVRYIQQNPQILTSAVRQAVPVALAEVENQPQLVQSIVEQAWPVLEPRVKKLVEGQATQVKDDASVSFWWLTAAFGGALAAFLLLKKK